MHMNMMKKMTGNKNYKIGRNFEYVVKQYLKENGWDVKRAYASKGIFDLLAYKLPIKLGVQVKSLSSNKNRAYLDPTERNMLQDYFDKPSQPYEFVNWNKKYQMPLLQLIDDVFVVVHAYNMFDGIGWRILMANGWRDVYISRDVTID